MSTEKRRKSCVGGGRLHPVVLPWSVTRLNAIASMTEEYSATELRKLWSEAGYLGCRGSWRKCPQHRHGLVRALINARLRMLYEEYCRSAKAGHKETDGEADELAAHARIAELGVDPAKFYGQNTQAKH